MLTIVGCNAVSGRSYYSLGPGSPGESPSRSITGGSFIVHRFRSAIAFAAIAALIAAAPIGAAGPPASRDATASTTALDKTSAIVILKEQAVALYDGHITGYEKTRVSQRQGQPE